MRSSYLAIIVMLGALAFVVYSVFSEGGYFTYTTLGRNLESQRQKNIEAEGQVEELRRKVYSLQNDERALERAARDELGLARPNEMIFTFEDSKK